MNTRLQTMMRVARHEGLLSLAGLMVRPQPPANANPPDEVGIVFEVLHGTGSVGIMIDVGAHHGSSLKHYIRAGWTVFAFEPDSINRAALTSRFGRYPTLHIDPRALSNQATESATFYRSQQSTGISGLTAFHPSHEAASSVPVTTLTDFCAAHPDLKHIDFLKIDTEGHDLKVLQGLPWDKVVPKVIVCEFEDAKTKQIGYGFSDLADYLLNHGYHIIVSEWHPIQQYGAEHTWRRFASYPCTLVDTRAWGNLIATNDMAILKRLNSHCGLTAAPAQ